MPTVDSRNPGYRSRAILEVSAALYVAALPLMWGFRAQRLGFWTIAADWLFLLLLPAAILHLYRRIAASGVPRFVPVVLGYVAGNAWLVLYSTDPTASAHKLLVTAYMALIAIAFAEASATDRGMWRIAGGWVVGAATTAGLGLTGVLLFYSGVPDNPFVRSAGSLPLANYPRAAGLFLNVNMMANYLVIAAPLSFIWLDKDRGRLRVFLGVITLIALLSLSPGSAALVLAIALSVNSRLTWDEARPVFSRLGLVLAGAAAALMLAATVVSPEALLRGELLPSVRLRALSAAAQTVVEHPLAGAGLGTDVVGEEFRMPDGGISRFTDAHNISVNVLAQTGFIGLCFLAAVLATAVWIAAQRLRSDRWSRVLLIAIGCAWGYHGLTGSFEETRHAWALIGLALGGSLRRLTADHATRVRSEAP